MDLVAAAINKYWPQVTIHLFSQNDAVLQYETKPMLYLNIVEDNTILITGACNPSNPKEEQAAAYQVARTLSACSMGRLKICRRSADGDFWYQTIG